MRLFILSTFALIIAAGVLACNSNETLLSQNSRAPQTPQQVATPTDSARRITADELHKLWEKGDVLIIDTRAEQAFQESHIKGAISVPAGTVLSKLEELPRDKMIVAYCT